MLTAEVHRATRTRERSQADELFDAQFSSLPEISRADSETPVAVPTGALARAMTAWMALVFGVCYVALPTLTAAVGLNSGLIGDIFFNLPAFFMASVIAVVGATAARPHIKTSIRAPRDPVLSAWAGGLLAWAITHNLTWFLRPFSDFGAGELMAFVSLNIVEMGMIGMMLASFARTRVSAFALGAGFQLIVYGLLTALIAA